MQEERENKVYTAAKGACVVGDSNPLLPGWVISCCSACCDAKTQHHHPHGQCQQDAAKPPVMKGENLGPAQALPVKFRANTFKHWEKGIFRDYFLCCY